jgi:UDP-4-amino-4,6-dideoxy-N-acetyl-beta-L-altrosamine N-acetyltransferase
MIIRKYGLILKRIKKEDIELIRQMRNSEAVKRRMFFRQEISPEMQKKWFDSINNKYNGYYVIIYNDKKIGLIHGKNVDFEKRTCEGGIFIWDPEYLNGIVSSLASIIMNDWTFCLGNFKAIYAKVLKENRIALAYNKLQGYEPCEPQNDDKGVEWLMLTKENYTKRIDGIRKNMAQFIHDDKALQLADLDASDDLGEEIELFYKNLPSDLQSLADELITRAKKINP